MIGITSKRLRSMAVACVLAGCVVGLAGGYLVSFAQGDGYFCPPEYQTCSPDWGPLQPTDPGDGGGGGGGGTADTCHNGAGVWTCPVGSINTGGTGGTVSCTSTGCKKISDAYPVRVCTFRKSGDGADCPPLEQCECR